MNAQPYVTLTDTDFRREVLEAEGPVLVDFWAPWCPPCRALGPTIEDLARVYQGTARVGKLDVDENPATASTYRIASIPAVLVFQSGQVVDRIVGLQPRARYERAIEAALTGAGR